MAMAALRPAAMAVTIRSAPRTSSPAAYTPPTVASPVTFGFDLKNTRFPGLERRRLGWNQLVAGVTNGQDDHVGGYDEFRSLDGDAQAGRGALSGFSLRLGHHALEFDLANVALLIGDKAQRAGQKFVVYFFFFGVLKIILAGALISNSVPR